MKISEVQKFIRDRLTADETVGASHASVVCADDGDTVNKVSQAMADDGLIVIVLTPKFDPTSTSAKRPVGDLSVIVRVAEKPDLNRERGDFTLGVDLAEHIGVLLNLEKPFPNADILVLAKPGITASSQDGETVAWDVPFKMVHQLHA